MFKTEVLAFFHQLKSIPFVQGYLQKCYEKLHIKDSDIVSYQNAEKFIYYLEHGESFLKQAKQAPFSIKPILLFYGLNQLLKSCLLTKRPNYPENTKLLAHGVSTRKRKKQSYSFLSDEVKFQQYGLFPYFSNHLFQIQSFPTDKVSMDHLLARIPELKEIHAFQSRSFQLVGVGTINNPYLKFPMSIAEDWHITNSRLAEKIALFLPKAEKLIMEDSFITFKLEKPLSPFESGLFYLHKDDEQFYMCTNKATFFPLHEVMTHYLILYNLSMIGRYETEWWGELLHTFASDDYSFILQYVHIAEEKIPLMLGYELLRKWVD